MPRRSDPGIRISTPAGASIEQPCPGYDVQQVCRLVRALAENVVPVDSTWTFDPGSPS